MNEGDAPANEREKVRPRVGADVTEAGGVLADGERIAQAGRNADEDRRSRRAEGDGGRLDDHAGEDGGHWRESQADEQRHGEGRGGAEPGGAFDKRAEEPGDDDRLHAAVGGDVVELAADRLHGAALLERVEEQHGGEDNEEELAGNDGALGRRGRDERSANEAQRT